MPKFVFRFLLIILNTITTARLASAAEVNPLFGAELTFKKMGLPDETSWAPQNEMREYIQKLSQQQRDRKAKNYFEYDQGNQFTYPNLKGFWFSVGSDPDVIEIRAKPATFEEWKEAAPILQKDVFDLLKKMKIAPHRYEGGGHIHISSPALKSPLVMRNYIVDGVNNWELGAGVLGINRDDGYGPSINYKNYNEDASYGYQPSSGRSKGKQFEGELSLKDRVAAFRAAVSSVDSWIRGRRASSSQVKEELKLGTGDTRYTAINLQNDETIEHRYYLPQKSMSQFIDLVTVERARLRMIAKRKTPIPVRRDFPVVVAVTPAAGAKAFKEYVQKTGLDYNKYTSLLPVKYQNALGKIRKGGKGHEQESKVYNLDVITQVTGSSCSFAALSNAIQFWNPRFDLDQKKWLSSKTLKNWKSKLGDGGNGVTLEEFQHLTTDVLESLLISDYDITAFRLPTKGKQGEVPPAPVVKRIESLLMEFYENDGTKQIIVEINPEVLWGKQSIQVLSGPVGHYVHVQSYDPKTKRVTLGDPYPDYPRQYTLRVTDLLRGMNTADDDVRNKRKGILVIDFPRAEKGLGILDDIENFGFEREDSLACSALF